MTLSIPQKMMTNAITKSTYSVGTQQVGYYSHVCLESFSVRDTMSYQMFKENSYQGFTMLSKAFTSIQFSQENDFIHPVYSKQHDFFFSFEHTPPSISPQLPLKHNQCLPTRLPSTSCLVTTSPLLSTTKCLTNSMSELNLETPLIYPLTGLTEGGFA